MTSRRKSQKVGDAKKKKNAASVLDDESGSQDELCNFLARVTMWVHHHQHLITFFFFFFNIMPLTLIWLFCLAKSSERVGQVMQRNWFGERRRLDISAQGRGPFRWRRHLGKKPSVVFIPGECFFFPGEGSLQSHPA